MKETRQRFASAGFLFRGCPFCSESLLVAATRIIAGLVVIFGFVMMRIGVVRLFVRIFFRAVIVVLILVLVMVFLVDFDA